MAESNKGGDIRIVKKKHGEHGHHGGAWKVAYADFVTAMMAFFLVMWIVGLSQNIKEAIAAYFKDPVGFMKAVNEGKLAFSISPDGGAAKAGEKEPSKIAEVSEKQRMELAKQELEKVVAGMPEFKHLKPYVQIQVVDEGLRIELLESSQSVFFLTGSAEINPKARQLLLQIAKYLAKLPNRIIIEGHTDSRPFSRGGMTNWELSVNRANSARRVLEAGGVRKGQIYEVRGYADNKLRVPDDPYHYSNRRISLLIAYNKELK
ncbi:MAG: OmpA family protein [Chthonomonadetes bacterium]|nr:OmpA family protein [Chthonomonadetes bacterium]